MHVQLDTIILFCGDADLLKQFYTSHFGFTVLEETPSEWVVMNAGKVRIGLHRIGEAYRSEEPFRAESNVKLVFDVEEDLHTLRQRMLDQQIVVQEIKSYDNYPYWICDGEDPEGNVFQLRQSR